MTEPLNERIKKKLAQKAGLGALTTTPNRKIPKGGGGGASPPPKKKKPPKQRKKQKAPKPPITAPCLVKIPRLPDVSKFEAIYSAATESWTGTLTIPTDPPLVFTAVNSGIKGVFPKLDRQYRKYMHEKLGIANGGVVDNSRAGDAKFFDDTVNRTREEALDLNPPATIE